MNPSRPEAEVVAIREGRVLAVGSLEEVEGWGQYEIDRTFESKFLMPGLIEAHCHCTAGSLWKYPYVGFFDRYAPDNHPWPGCKSVEEVICRLVDIEAQMGDAGEPMIAWGLDPIYFEGERMVAAHLDKVSTTRNIFVLHANGHLATVNTALMHNFGIDHNTNVEGVPKGPNGKPTGELQEPQAMMLTGEIFNQFIKAYREEATWQNYGREARNAGITTVAELGFPGLDDDAVAFLQRTINDPDFPVRVSVLYGAYMIENPDWELVADYVAGLREQNSEKLRLGIVKVFLDGSIQAFTARLRAPGYYGRTGNGLWLTPPDNFKNMFLPFHKRGLSIHCHCNGDEAVDVFLDAIENMLAEASWPDHRHTVEHCQLTTMDQYRRMARLGVCANIFSNHIFFWGDQHYELTVGPDRAQRMEACATALQAGVPFSLHSDAPVTPMGQLHTAWCAVNRRTASGRTLGETEKISVYEALKAVTLNAAYTLKLDHEIGSIEPGKLADFTVLENDPLSVAPVELKDIPVWGTVLGGKHFPVKRGVD